MSHPHPHRLPILLTLIALLLLPLLPVHAQPTVPDYTRAITADQLAAHISVLADDIGPRVAGSDAEARAAAYVQAQFTAWGYAVTLQSFTFNAASDDTAVAALTSHNVIATRLATRPGPVRRTIIVGAHLDSVETGTGADDNASGVAAMLAAAEVLADLDTVHDLVFIAFGAEEEGLLGSRAYVDALTEAQREAVWVMFNVDTVGIGDYAHVYAGAVIQSETDYDAGPTWARDLALSVARDLGLDLRTSPPDGWNGFTGPWSDHYPFVQAGIAVAYFERWNWDAGDNAYWGVETAEYGDFLHTEFDTTEYVDPALVEPVAEVLARTVALLAAGEVRNVEQ